MVYPVGRRRRSGRPGLPVPPPRGASMARAPRPVLWRPGLGAGGGRRRPERRGGASRQLRSCFPRPPPRSLPRPAPEAPEIGWKTGAGARPRLEPARRPRAPRSRPGRHLLGLEATSSSGQTLPTVSPQGRPGRCSTSPARPARGTRQGSGGGGQAARHSAQSLAQTVPPPAQGLEEPGRRRGRVTSLAPPLPINALSAHPPVLTPFRSCSVLSLGL